MNPLRGVEWMVFSSAFYALVYGVVRVLSENLSAFEVTLGRAVFGSLFAFPFVLAVGLRVLRTTRWRLYAVRVGLTYGGTLLWVYGIANLPLADANALLFTGPLFATLFAVLFLGEKVGARRIAATLTGFLGALIIIRPGLVPVGLPALASLGAAALFAASSVATSSLTRSEHPNAIVFYLYFLMIPAAIGPAAVDFTMPTGWDLFWVLALGLTSIGAQQGATRAVANAPVSLVSPIGYLQLPLIALVGYLAFGQVPSVWTWAGAAVICASTYYIMLREARSRQKRMK